MKDENTRRLAMPLPPPSEPPPNPRETLTPADALTDATMRLHVWQEQRSQLARLGQPNVLLVQRCLDEIARAQADADAARAALAEGEV